MKRQNVGYLNNNWRGGHRSDVEYAAPELTEREKLAIKIEACQRVMDGIVDKSSYFYGEMKQKLDEYEQFQIRDEMVACVSPMMDALLYGVALTEETDTEIVNDLNWLGGSDACVNPDGCGNDADLWNVARGR